MRKSNFGTRVQHFFEKAASMSDDNSEVEADVVHDVSTTENREHHSRPDRVLTSPCMPPTKGGRSVWRKLTSRFGEVVREALDVSTRRGGDGELSTAFCLPP